MPRLAVNRRRRQRRSDEISYCQQAAANLRPARLRHKERQGFERRFEHARLLVEVSSVRLRGGEVNSVGKDRLEGSESNCAERR